MATKEFSVRAGTASFVCGLLVILAVLSGCGSAGEDGTSSSPGTAPEPAGERDSGGGSRQFVVEGGDNSVQEFGDEAGQRDFEAAAASLHRFLDAKVNGRWAAACSQLAAPVREELEQMGPSPSSCAKALAELSSGVPRRFLEEAALADVGSLRAEGPRGLAIYWGADRVPYAMPMAREGGLWKVAALAAISLS